MPRVTFVHKQRQEGVVPHDVTLLEAAELLGIQLHHDCGGNASCSTCRVAVQEGPEHLSEIDFDEQDLLDREALTDPCWRLSCQARVRGDVVVLVPEDKWMTPDLTASPEELARALNRVWTELENAQG